jgi:HEAT repeat protein
VGAICVLTEFPHEVLPELIAVFDKEQDKRIRKFLVKVIWQHRQCSVISLLAEALYDPEPDVWKEALNGLAGFSADIGCPRFRGNLSVSQTT